MYSIFLILNGFNALSSKTKKDEVREEVRRLNVDTKMKMTDDNLIHFTSSTSCDLFELGDSPDQAWTHFLTYKQQLIQNCFIEDEGSLKLSNIKYSNETIYMDFVVSGYTIEELLSVLSDCRINEGIFVNNEIQIEDGIQSDDKLDDKDVDKENSFDIKNVINNKAINVVINKSHADLINDFQAEGDAIHEILKKEVSADFKIVEIQPNPDHEDNEIIIKIIPLEESNIDVVRRIHNIDYESNSLLSVKNLEVHSTTTTTTTKTKSVASSSVKDKTNSTTITTSVKKVESSSTTTKSTSTKVDDKTTKSTVTTIKPNEEGTTTENAGLSTGAITGISAGAAALLGLISAGGWFVMKKNKEGNDVVEVEKNSLTTEEGPTPALRGTLRARSPAQRSRNEPFNL